VSDDESLSFSGDMGMLSFLPALRHAACFTEPSPVSRSFIFPI
jgi:hypothetical protein